MSIVNFGIGDELLYYVELKEGMDAASEIAGIFITPAFLNWNIFWHLMYTQKRAMPRSLTGREISFSNPIMNTT